MTKQQKARSSGPPMAHAFTATIGVVVTAVPAGRTPFAVAYPTPESATDELTVNTSITISLTNSHWKGDELPEFGQTVELEYIGLFAKGWRANIARPVVMNVNSSKQKAEVGK